MRSREALNPSSSRYHSGGYNTPTVIVWSLISLSPHHVLGAVFRLDVAHEHEAVLLQDANRCGILRVGAGGDRWVRTEPEHDVIDEGADRGGADAVPDESGIAEQVVHPRGAAPDAHGRAPLAVLGVVTDVVHLEVSDVPTVEDEDPRCHRLVASDRARHLVDLLGLPPRSHVRFVQPRGDEREVVGRHRPKGELHRSAPSSTAPDGSVIAPVTSATSAPSTCDVDVPRIWRTASGVWFTPWMNASPFEPPCVFTGSAPSGHAVAPDSIIGPPSPSPQKPYCSSESGTAIVK